MLTKTQRKQLHDAILRTFNHSSLERELLLELDKKLNAIASQGNFQNVVLDVIKTGEMEGWIQELVEALHKARPKEATFQMLCESSELSPTDSKGKQIEKEETNDEIRHLEGMLSIHKKRLRVLEMQIAQFGISAPAHITIESEDIKEKIAEIVRQIKTI